jgi:hypothetical protein
MIELRKINENFINSSYLRNSCFNTNWLKLILKSHELNLKELIIDKKIIYVVEQKIFFKKYLISLPMIYNLNLDNEFYDHIFKHRIRLKLFLKNNNFFDLIIKSSYEMVKQNNKYFKTSWLDFAIDLSNDLKKIANDFNENTKRDLNVSSANYSIEFSADVDEIVKYFENYSNYNKTKGYFCYTKKIFDNLTTFMSSKKDFLIINLRNIKSKELVGGVFFYLNSSNMKAVYLNSWRDTKEKFPVIKFLFFEAIKYLKKNHYLEISLGRNEESNKGLTRFKSNWNSNVTKLYYFSLRKKNYQILEKKFILILVKLFIRFLPYGIYLKINSFMSKILFKF